MLIHSRLLVEQKRKRIEYKLQRTNSRGMSTANDRSFITYRNLNVALWIKVHVDIILKKLPQILLTKIVESNKFKIIGNI